MLCYVVVRISNIPSGEYRTVSIGLGSLVKCGMRKVKYGIQKCGNLCGMVGKMGNVES